MKALKITGYSIMILLIVWSAFQLLEPASLFLAHGRLEKISLHDAADGHPIDLDYILSLKRDIEERDSKGETPLFRAVRAGNTANIVLLLRAGAKTDVKNNRQLSPLDIRPNDEEIRRLLEARAQGAEFDELLPPSLTTPAR